MRGVLDVMYELPDKYAGGDGTLDPTNEENVEFNIEVLQQRDGQPWRTVEGKTSLNSPVMTSFTDKNKDKDQRFRIWVDDLHEGASLKTQVRARTINDSIMNNEYFDEPCDILNDPDCPSTGVYKQKKDFTVKKSVWHVVADKPSDYMAYGLADFPKHQKLPEGLKLTDTVSWTKASTIDQCKKDCLDRTTTPFSGSQAIPCNAFTFFADDGSSTDPTNRCKLMAVPGFVDVNEQSWVNEKQDLKCTIDDCNKVIGEIRSECIDECVCDPTKPDEPCTQINQLRRNPKRIPWRVHGFLLHPKTHNMTCTMDNNDCTTKGFTFGPQLWQGIQGDKLDEYKTKYIDLDGNWHQTKDLKECAEICKNDYDCRLFTYFTKGGRTSNATEKCKTFKPTKFKTDFTKYDWLSAENDGRERIHGAFLPKMKNTCVIGGSDPNTKCTGGDYDQFLQGIGEDWNVPVEWTLVNDKKDKQIDDRYKIKTVGEFSAIGCQSICGKTDGCTSYSYNDDDSPQPTTNCVLSKVPMTNDVNKVDFVDRGDTIDRFHGFSLPVSVAENTPKITPTDCATSVWSAWKPTDSSLDTSQACGVKHVQTATRTYTPATNGGNNRCDTDVTKAQAYLRQCKVENQSCTRNHDCGSGLNCVGGYCRKPTDCATGDWSAWNPTDSSLDTSQACGVEQVQTATRTYTPATNGGNNTCDTDVTRKQAYLRQCKAENQSCTRNHDCGSGLNCIDGTCKQPKDCTHGDWSDWIPTTAHLDMNQPCEWHIQQRKEQLVKTRGENGGKDDCVTNTDTQNYYRTCRDKDQQCVHQYDCKGGLNCVGGYCREPIACSYNDWSAWSPTDAQIDRGDEGCSKDVTQARSRTHNEAQYGGNNDCKLQSNLQDTKSRTAPTCVPHKTYHTHITDKLQEYPENGGDGGHTWTAQNTEDECKRHCDTINGHNDICTGYTYFIRGGNSGNASLNCKTLHNIDVNDVRWLTSGSSTASRARHHGFTTTLRYVAPTPVNCEVGDWTPWNPSTLPCGQQTTQTRTRTVTRRPEHGGTACPTLSDSQVKTGLACPKEYVKSWYAQVGGYNIDEYGIPNNYNLLCSNETPLSKTCRSRGYTQKMVQDKCDALGTKCKGYHWHNLQKYGQLKTNTFHSHHNLNFDKYTKK